MIDIDGLWADLEALCDCGGREAGSASEARALEFAPARLASIAPSVRTVRVPYGAWRLDEVALSIPGGAPLVCHALVGSQSTPAAGMTLEACDLGRGTPEDFAANAARIPGRCVIVRHEYPFSRTHIHRRRKLGWAMERGAAAFLIASPEPGMGSVAGSSGRGGGVGIPAIGTDFESAATIAEAGRVHLKVIGEDFAGESSVLILDLPGKTSRWVALSAHLDGHSLAESAMDNGTGVATVMALARHFAPGMRDRRLGLRVCLFSAEEWALAGSKSYLDRMTDAERRSIAINVNLDTVGGDTTLTALTSEFPRLEKWVSATASQADLSVGTYAPMMSNSDHYNFARQGIPAFRLVAGFDRPQSNVRYILTRGDTRDKVKRPELEFAAKVSEALIERALDMSDAELEALR